MTSTDFDLCVEEAKAAMGEHEITDACARVIASLYHDGGARTLAFVASGFITESFVTEYAGSSTELYRLFFPNYGALSADERLLADMLGTYLVQRVIAGNGGTVEGWTELWIGEPYAAYAWPGGYDVAYYVGSSVLCAGCATKDRHANNNGEGGPFSLLGMDSTDSWDDGEACDECGKWLGPERATASEVEASEVEASESDDDRDHRETLAEIVAGRGNPKGAE